MRAAQLVSVVVVGVVVVVVLVRPERLAANQGGWARAGRGLRRARKQKKKGGERGGD